MDFIEKYLCYKNLLMERRYSEALKVFDEIKKELEQEGDELKDYLWRTTLEESSFNNAGSCF